MMTTSGQMHDRKCGKVFDSPASMVYCVERDFHRCLEPQRSDQMIEQVRETDR